MHGVLGWSYEGLQTRLNGSERFVWLAGTSGLVLIVLLSALVGLSSSPAVGKVILVLLLFTTAPFFARILIVPATWKVNAAEKAVLILNVVFIALGLIWILALYENLTSLLMMDVELSYDALHYTSYLAPSLAVKGGGIPLVDVFCQYGLCYLIFNLFFLVFPPTFHSAALLVTIINTATTMLG